MVYLQTQALHLRAGLVAALSGLDCVLPIIVNRILKKSDVDLSAPSFNIFGYSVMTCWIMFKFNGMTKLGRVRGRPHTPSDKA